jgi:putative ABC transport system ATP-binding protein
MAQVPQALDLVGLRDKWECMPSELSGGEQQRVAIAAAAARRPRLVLADEPTGELDAANEAIVLETLGKLRETYQSAVVLITHSRQVAAACDRMVEIVDGRVAG